MIGENALDLYIRLLLALVTKHHSNMFNISLRDVGSFKLRKLIFPVLWIGLLVWTSKVAFTHYERRPTVLTSIPTGRLDSSPNSNYVLPYDPLHGQLVEPMTVNISSSAKVAVIIETRGSGNLVPLILHFAAVLGPSWPVLVYTDTQLVGSFWTSAALVRHQRSGRIVLRPLPDGVSFPSWDSVSNFMVRRWLWEDLAPAEYILIFQSDSIICANAARSVEDFFEYDLIGAPIKGGWGTGYNGGLSLRRRSTTLRVLDMELPRDLPEDQWYYHKFKQLMEEDEEEGVENGVRLPTVGIARTFAVETIDYPHPIGFHQPTRFIAEHMLDINEWCPEYKLATGGSAYF